MQLRPRQTSLRELPDTNSKLGQTGRLTKEHNMNYVPPSFMEDVMFRAVVEEAAALTSITLFLGMIAVWAQVLGAL
jgi:hypothetical protein